MEDIDRLEQLLKQRPFKSLTEEERNLVFRFVSSEEEYDSLRSTEMDLRKFAKSGAEIRPRKDTLSKVKKTISQNHEKEKLFWLRPTVPAYAMMVLVIVVGAVGWWAGAKYGSEKVLVEKVIPRIDTLRIVSKPDTVVKERIIYLPMQPVVTAVNQAEKSESLTAKGVNMKDKEELERLLVSGSY